MFMNNSDLKTSKLKELTKTHSESTNSDYLAWRDTKVEDALSDDKANPDQRISQHAMWEKFKLEH